MGEVMIPPWVLPETPEVWRLVDDSTQAFNPQFGRGQTQVAIWADPRWGLTRKYRGLRSDQLAAILSALDERRGQANVMRVAAHKLQRGSFPSSDVLSNGTFANGTTGYTGISANLTVADRILRVACDGDISSGPRATQTVTVSANVPYAVRAMLMAGRGGSAFLVQDATLGVTSAVTNGSALATVVSVPTGTTLTFRIGESAVSQVDNYFLCPYAAVARCPLVDTGVNMLLRSQDINNAAWVQSGITSIATGAAGAPDGSSTVQTVTENSVNTQHGVTQTLTVPAAVADYTYAAIVKASGRQWVYLDLDDAITHARIWFNISTGVVGTSTLGASFTNARTVVKSLGLNWYYIAVTVRKTTSATTMHAAIFAATGDTNTSYLGTGAVPFSHWMSGMAPSSVPMRVVLTTSTATTGTAPTGATMYLKGLPVSTDGLFEVSDVFEWGGELKRFTARVNSDAAGFGFAQFRPGLAGSPADSDPLIVNNPMGRFMCASSAQEFENQFGIYGEADLELIERYNS